MLNRTWLALLEGWCWDEKAVLLACPLWLEAARSVRSWQWGMDAHPWYFIWSLSYLSFLRGGGLNQSSTASTNWPISFFAAHPSICPLCLWFFQVLCFFMHSLLFSLQYACLFLCHVCQINNNLSQVLAVEAILNLFSKICIKSYKWG